MITNLKTIQSLTKSTYRSLGSKFLGYLFPSNSLEEFEAQLADIKKEHPHATHHCPAYRLNPANILEFSSDDGEPSGTAGLPILNQLKSFEVVNAGLVVVRYYGGTKLGKPGLIESYGGTARTCLEEASFLNVVPCQWFEITYNYPEQSIIEKLKKDFELREENASYLEQVTLRVASLLETSNLLERRLEEITHLSVSFEKLETGFYYE